MKIAMVLAVMPMLLASTAYAMGGYGGFGGYGLGNVDIVGSDLKDIKICSDDFYMGDTEIVGSSVNNVDISTVPYEKPIYIEREQPIYEAPFSMPHRGVDAWYGRYWFNDQIYMPKWPQMY